MRTKLILLFLLTVVAFSSCSKSRKQTTTSSDEQPLALSINLLELNMSKSVGTASVLGVASIKDNKITVHVLGGATILSSTDYIVTDLDFFTKSGDVYTSVNGLIAVTSDATSIRVIANEDNGNTLTSHINFRQGPITSNAVRLIGEGNITGEDDSKSCSITIKPEMARIEVKGAMPAANDQYVKDVTLQAIYLNNTIMIRPTSDEQTKTDFSRTLPNSSTKVWDNNPYISSGDKAMLFDSFISFNKGTGIGHGKGFIDEGTAGTYSCGFNIFTQSGTSGDRIEASKYHPHLVFEFKLNRATAIDDDEVATAWSGVNTYFLNVIAFKDGSDFVTTFEGGNVYQFDLATIYALMNNTYPSVLTDMPDPEREGVELVVTVGSWEVTTITPVI